jgi:hypothetical protein
MLDPNYVVGLVDGEGCFSFVKFCKVAELLKLKRHLSLEGLNTIQAIKAGDSLDALDAHV